MNIPKGLISKERDTRDFVKGFNSPIPYVVRNPTGNWYLYLSQKQPQKYGQFETNNCWNLAHINDIETQLNFLFDTGQFPQESINWFKDNGYFDSSMRFDLSEQFIGIISGARDNGNDQIEGWRLSKLNGILPRKDLAYTDDQAYQFTSQEAFANDYFNPARIKPEMRQKALDSLKYIAIAYEWLGKRWQTPNLTDMKATLLNSPLQIGVPVPKDVNTWNKETVIYDGSKTADHSILNYFIEADGKYTTRDQYNPFDKSLDKKYYLPLVTHGVVTPILQPPYIPPATAKPYPKNIFVLMWESVNEYFRTRFYK
jgi:hypothetical protein